MTVQNTKRKKKEREWFAGREEILQIGSALVALDTEQKTSCNKCQ